MIDADAVRRKLGELIEPEQRVRASTKAEAEASAA